MLAEETEVDIFVFFEGAQCYACEKVWPEFQSLAQYVAGGSPKLVFAYIDLAQNQLSPSDEIYGSPIIRLY